LPKLGAILTDITATVESGAEFRIGLVFSQTFGTLKNKFRTYFLLASISVLPMAVYLLTRGTEGMDVPRILFNPYYLTAVVLQDVLSRVAHAMIAYGVFQDLSKRDFSIGESVNQGLRRFFPVVGTAILMGLAIYAGAVLAVIPGLMLMIMLSVGIPACMVERLGPIESLTRSSALTMGYRWKVFGILMILGIATIVGSVATEFILDLLAGPTVIRWLPWVSLLAQVIMGAINGVAVAAMYSALRSAKEGIDIQSIASVFE